MLAHLKENTRTMKMDLCVADESGNLNPKIIKWMCVICYDPMYSSLGNSTRCFTLDDNTRPLLHFT